MRPRSRRLLVCLLGLGICAAALSAFQAGFLRSNFALLPEVANRAPDTKVTLCTQVRSHDPSAAQRMVYRPSCSPSIISGCCVALQDAVCVLRAGPQRHAIPGELALVLSLCRPAIDDLVCICCQLRTALMTVRSPSRHASRALAPGAACSVQQCHDICCAACATSAAMPVVLMSCHRRSCMWQVEYIEFMKLMGIARFIICDESSDDDIHLLQACLAACHQCQTLSLSHR